MENHAKYTNMTVPDRKFFALYSSSESVSECFPAINDRREEQLSIALPTRAPINVSHVIIPIFGCVFVELCRDPDRGRKIAYVTSVTTGQSFQGPLFDCVENSIPPPKTEPPDPKDLVGLWVGDRFSYDLLNYVNIPLVEDFYEVEVRWGGLRSNRVRVELYVGDPTRDPLMKQNYGVRRKIDFLRRYDQS